MKVLITGLNGRVGSAVYNQLHDDYDIFGLDIQDHEDRETFIASISEFQEIRPAFDDMDAVVHLAAKPYPWHPWDEILKYNIIGTYNVIECAHQAGVQKIIFASSVRTIHMYEEDHKPEIYQKDFALKVDHSDPVRPDSYYAVSKLFGENLGRMYVENKSPPSQFYALRFGGVRGPEDDHPYSDAERGVEQGEFERGSEEYMRKVYRRKALWFSHRDIGQMINKMLRDESVSFDIFYGVSGNERRWVDIEHAREILGYNPHDNGEEWEGPPSD